MTNLEDLLTNTDFSQDSRNREAMKATLLDTCKREEQKYAKGGIIMKFRARPRYIAAVAAVLSVAVLIAACGEEMVRAIQQFSVGRHASFVVYNGRNNVCLNTEETQGKITEEFIGPVFSYEAEMEREKDIVTYFDTIDDVKPYLAFNPLIPAFVPGNFTLDRISLFNDENGSHLQLGANIFLNVYYANTDKTQQIYMQLRVMNEETAFISTASHDMRYVLINGYEGVVDDKDVHVEMDGVMYMILAGRAASVTQDDMIRMAASLR